MRVVPCACDACTFLVTETVEDGFCELCSNRCYPASIAGGVRQRLSMNYVSRVEIHRIHDGKRRGAASEADPLAGLGQAIREVIREHGPVVVRHGVKTLVRRWLKR